MSRRYCVRRSSSRDYVAAVMGDYPSAWTTCKRCAKRFTRDQAHRIAHGTGRRFKVVRIRPRSSP